MQAQRRYGAVDGSAGLVATVPGCVDLLYRYALSFIIVFVVLVVFLVALVMLLVVLVFLALLLKSESPINSRRPVPVPAE